jgi:hypothetical protein
MAGAEQALKAASIPVQTLACPGLGHSIDDAGIRKGLEFLQAHFHLSSLSAHNTRLHLPG